MAWHDKLLLKCVKETSFLLRLYVYKFIVSVVGSVFITKKSPAPAREPAKPYFLTTARRRKKCSVRRISPKCKLSASFKADRFVCFLCPALTYPLSVVHGKCCAVCESRGPFLPELCGSSVSVVCIPPLVASGFCSQQ